MSDSNKRMKLGIIFNFKSTWMGGLIYILNIIKTLNFLDDEDKPEIYLFYRSDLKKYTDEIDYPYLNLVEWNFPSYIKSYLKSVVLRRNLLAENILNEYKELDGLYPFRDYPVKSKQDTKLVAWYADLQHEYYPEFFSRRTRFERTRRIKLIIKNATDLVVSSQAVADDFHKFFRVRKDLNMHVYHFVSVLEDFEHLDIKSLKEKYNLPDKYFIISNQFHKHKNHKVVLKAMVRLKEQGKLIHVAMTGRFPEASQSPYMQELHDLINKHELQSQISNLGVLPRDEQLFLMKHSQAVIQPSLFEGWSTVIEDARSLQLPVIAASLPVNIEQLGEDKEYFDPHDDEKLAEMMADYPDRNINDKFYKDYHERMQEAASIFLDIFKK